MKVTKWADYFCFLDLKKKKWAEAQDKKEAVNREKEGKRKYIGEIEKGYELK